MVTTEEKQQRKASRTIADQDNLNSHLRNIEYEDHFLMFNRAGNHAPYLQKVIDYTDGRTIEFGCGTGTQALAVEPYVERAIGVEIDDDRIRLTHERCSRMDAPTYFVRGDMFKLPFEDNTFSTAFNSGVFQHFDDDGITEIINEASRVARDYLVLSVANSWFPYNPDHNTRRKESHEWWCET
jgi:ubiquinone/menaquinone biosynthesis C-methylase UbiE